MTWYLWSTARWPHRVPKRVARRRRKFPYFVNSAVSQNIFMWRNLIAIFSTTFYLNSRSTSTKQSARNMARLWTLWSCLSRHAAYSINKLALGRSGRAGDPESRLYHLGIVDNRFLLFFTMVVKWMLEVDPDYSCGVALVRTSPRLVRFIFFLAPLITPPYDIRYEGSCEVSCFRTAIMYRVMSQAIQSAFSEKVFTRRFRNALSKRRGSKVNRMLGSVFSVFQQASRKKFFARKRGKGRLHPG